MSIKMFKNRKAEEGLTLVELLVVIALVGVVAAIALPIVSNVLAGAQADADTNSTENINKFNTDWAAAGYNLSTVNGIIYATDKTDGSTIAQIKAGTGSNTGGGNTGPAFDALTIQNIVADTDNDTVSWDAVPGAVSYDITSYDYISGASGNYTTSGTSQQMFPVNPSEWDMVVTITAYNANGVASQTATTYIGEAT